MTEFLHFDRAFRSLILKAFSAFSAAFVVSMCIPEALAQSDKDVITVKTELVTFEVSVTDKDGRPVRGLGLEDFEIFEEDERRNADFFESVHSKDPARPLSLVLALDMSGSMTESELQRLKSALAGFSQRLAGGHSYFAITTFAMNVSTVQSFTNRKDRLESSILRLKRDRDGLSTHAYDAVDHGIRLLNTRGPVYSANRLAKRAIVLITDGFPVGDIVKPETVIERALESDISVYSLILPSYSRNQRSSKPILTPLEASGLIEQTRGRSFYATNDNFEPLFRALEEEIAGNYAIAFYPTRREGQKAEFRNVKIVSRKGFAVSQNRPGYKAPE
ncbi:MAG TPA: VWA domain-containing protein [Pyrinomonadaceae bacterium]|nr:VWA domain-containing protein [Pyrinomonadaceae bacterium]